MDHHTQLFSFFLPTGSTEAPLLPSKVTEINIISWTRWHLGGTGAEAYQVQGQPELLTGPAPTLKKKQNQNKYKTY